MSSQILYSSPVGKLLLRNEDEKLTDIIFAGDKVISIEEKDSDVLRKTKMWLDLYFSGKVPDFVPDFKLEGSDFQIQVLKEIQKIPYGENMTYGEIAREVAKERGIDKMSPQAVGNAAGKNRIPIIIPCHRVLGAGNRLKGYSGGIEIKKYLLELEGIYYK